MSIFPLPSANSNRDAPFPAREGSWSDAATVKTASHDAEVAGVTSEPYSSTTTRVSPGTEVGAAGVLQRAVTPGLQDAASWNIRSYLWACSSSSWRSRDCSGVETLA